MPDREVRSGMQTSSRQIVPAPGNGTGRRNSARHGTNTNRGRRGTQEVNHASHSRNFENAVNEVKIEENISVSNSKDNSKSESIQFVMKKDGLVFDNPNTPQLRAVLKRASIVGSVLQRFITAKYRFWQTIVQRLRCPSLSHLNFQELDQ